MREEEEEEEEKGGGGGGGEHRIGLRLRGREMGKYIRKAKTRGELAVMEVSQSSLGVRTRAKTLALQNSNSNSNSYLQLRSRRLQKPLPNVVVNGTHDSKRHKNSNAAAATTTANDNNSKEPHIQNHDEIVGVGVCVEDTNQQEDNLINKTDFGVQEASFGENVLDFEARERWVFLSSSSSLSFYLNLCCLR